MGSKQQVPDGMIIGPTNPIIEEALGDRLGEEDDLGADVHAEVGPPPPARNGAYNMVCSSRTPARAAKFLVLILGEIVLSRRSGAVQRGLRPPGARVMVL